MQVQVTFRGCECGCREGDKTTFTGNSMKYINKAIAMYCLNGRIDNDKDDIFERIIGVPEEAKAITLDAVKMLKRKKEIENRFEEIHSIVSDIKKAVEILEIEIPANKAVEVENNESELQTLQTEYEELRDNFMDRVQYEEENAVTIDSESIPAEVDPEAQKRAEMKKNMLSRLQGMNSEDGAGGLMNLLRMLGGNPDNE